MWKETIHVEAPYDFDLVLERIGLDPLYEIDYRNRLIRVPLMIHGKPNVYIVQAIGTVDKPVFVISGKEEQAMATKRLTEIFQWHLPLSDIHEHFGGTKLNDLFTLHRGTPLILEFDLYSCLVKSIIHQQLNMAFAQKLTKDFVTTYGFQKDGVWFYPSPETVATLTVDELKQMKFSGRKAEYVIGLSEKVSSSDLDLEALSTKSDEEIIHELTKIRGVGRWTAENFLLFGLGRPNLFPKADIGIQNAIKLLFNLERKPTMEEMEQFSKEWNPYLSYASLYLWRSIEKRRNIDEATGSISP